MNRAKVAKSRLSHGAAGFFGFWVLKIAVVSLFVFASYGSIGPISAGALSDEAEDQAARLAFEARYEIGISDRDPERTVWIFRLVPQNS